MDPLSIDSPLVVRMMAGTRLTALKDRRAKPCACAWRTEFHTLTFILIFLSFFYPSSSHLSQYMLRINIRGGLCVTVTATASYYYYYYYYYY